MDIVTKTLSNDFLNIEFLTSPLFITFVVVFLILFKLFKVQSSPAKPFYQYLETDTNNKVCRVVDDIPMLHELYIPPIFGGRSGHLQTATYGIFGRAYCVDLANVRHSIILKDNTTVTFDIYEPMQKHAEGDFTVAICPGIANSSESGYIRWAVYSLQKAGYRCSVLNHVGAIKSIPVTSDRMFNYGEWSEYAAMMLKLNALHPETKFLCIGFSMGANIVTKFLGQNPMLKNLIVSGVSVCQGYDANKSAPLMHQWEHLRRFYTYIMTENMKRLIRHHYDQVVLPHVKKGIVDDTQLFNSTSLLTIDELYTRRILGFSSLEEYYDWCSCAPHIPNINVPMCFLNAADDPLVPDQLLDPVRKASSTKPDTLFVLTKHGGHLGYVEGNTWSLHEVTWLDRFLVEYVNAAVKVYASKCNDDDGTTK